MRWLVSKGWHGWALLLALVVAFDVAAAVWGGESMTDAARRWFNHGIGRWFVAASGSCTSRSTSRCCRIGSIRSIAATNGCSASSDRIKTYVNPPTDQYPPGKG